MKRKTSDLSAILGALILATALGAYIAPGAVTAAAAIETSAPAAKEDQRLLSFLDRAFDESIALSPQMLTSLGQKDQYGRLDDYSDGAPRKALALAERQLAQMKAQFSVEALSPAGRLSYRLFENEVERQRVSSKWRFHRHPVTNLASPAGSIPVFLINEHRIDTPEDAQAYLSRLREVERAMREVSRGLTTRAEMGIIVPRFTFEPVIADARKVISGAPFDTGPDSAVFADFKKKVHELGLSRQAEQTLVADASEALRGPFERGYEHLLATLQQLRQRAKGNDGAWSLPQGAEYYAAALKFHTTTGLSADEIHRIGLDEVARIHGEMEAIKRSVGFKGSLQDFFAHIENGARFHYPNTDTGRQAYLKDATNLIAQVMARAPALFHRLPKAKLEVRAVESWRQDTAGVAFYNSPAPDGSRPGIYYVNLADMRQVLQLQVEAISYHEGAPGHHFQIAFAQELDALPKFRRFAGYGAYVEGWGLYAERLGKELGFYTDPYSDFGRLSLELWRAVRLVTDTGLHAKRWSREQAIQYFQENTLLSDRDIVKEVERYIVMPGQATSYKIGQMKILELRAKAQQAIGAAFDVRDFHEVVLGSGALPLDILAGQVDAYISGTDLGS